MPVRFIACLLGLFIAVSVPHEVQAAITFVAGSFDSSGSGGGNTEGPGEPAGCAENDLVLAQYHVGATDGTVGHPSDFTELDDFTDTTGNPDVHLWIGYKIRGATAGETYQWTNSGTAGASAASVICLSGDEELSFDVTYVRASHYVDYENTPNGAAAEITTVTDNSMVVITGLWTQSISGAAGPSSGYTELYDQLEGAGTNQGHYWQGKVVATAATETPGDFTHTDTNGTADSRLFTLAVKEASSGVIIQRRRHE